MIIRPFSVDYGTSGNVFPNHYLTTSNLNPIDGHGVVASLAADATISMVFDIPIVSPGGTLKLELLSIADVAATQSAMLRILWAAVAAGETLNIAAGSLNDEHSGGTLEIEHTTSDDNEPKSTLITLDADTPVYGTDKYILMHVALKTSSWDLAVIWTFDARLTWGL